ncbi:hypothetical protein [Pseudomonas sp. Fl4BN1]|uniref:hypothetical protein n=1 Tax=Pseudomonas sp. Fl4BN1 TaxID=2697651 RepID=UPI00137804C0|nr:hypothetical protein [Pseudomonas sp. Fl4BN1]NBF12143.1 hypothetical protein [Pseudomonas sp. Fl4BN1]
MSKFGCTCGHVIVDQTDNLPYKASLVRDGHEEALYDALTSLSKALLMAVEAGRLDELMDQTYGKTSWRPKVTEYIQDQFSSLNIAHSSCVYECQNCGRLWVECGRENRFVSYAPDSGRYQAVLAVEPDQPG